MQMYTWHRRRSANKKSKTYFSAPFAAWRAPPARSQALQGCDVLWLTGLAPLSWAQVVAMTKTRHKEDDGASVSWCVEGSRQALSRLVQSGQRIFKARRTKPLQIARFQAR
jgi:hypothetical protein